MSDHLTGERLQRLSKTDRRIALFIYPIAQNILTNPLYISDEVYHTSLPDILLSIIGVDAGNTFPLDNVWGVGDVKYSLYKEDNPSSVKANYFDRYSKYFRSLLRDNVQNKPVVIKSGLKVDYDFRNDISDIRFNDKRIMIMDDGGKETVNKSSFVFFSMNEDKVKNAGILSSVQMFSRVNTEDNYFIIGDFSKIFSDSAGYGYLYGKFEEENFNHLKLKYGRIVIE